ncbi:hypothetical protein SERLA73DRAFT_164914 [Serpula lacrymans var. lacrymans S7.3]|uniref:DASH complex subunit ASK1 n=2 Tax=Serpula lacrymans var. lacrymans TaxID=341189 RepID=F8PG30_SERL3|nr:uncharacterized protein SERLADRAFT_444795 [Serpula lacrymans var. lacrymans S7.9]EGO05365.1 hypothetical protein SERLA73DRAFT_164914 [Serpula lacrymans var. lacrymans S7.3]EGO31215.1 hypothetical protein SERLADRAFT_444795 [Serpula lacrymans var. lacrymans S7.9]
MSSPIPPNPPRWEPSKDPANIVVPGLDTSAAVNDQIDQIEQLITIKLQNIDANFSRIQHLMSTKLLPAVKRYAVSTEPVREAAKFWTSFYEEAAQVRIPTYEEYSSLHEQQSQSDYEGSHSDTTPARTQSYGPNATSSDSSFMPGQGAISSTPATTSRHRTMHPHDSFASQDSHDQPSWAASIESPLVRLDREIQDLNKGEPSLHAPSVHSSYIDDSIVSDEDYEEEDTIQQRVGKGKSRDASGTLLNSVLRQNLRYDQSSSSALPTPRARNTPSSRVSPLKLKPKTPVPKHLNPYLPPNTEPSQWTGVVDLRDPSVATPNRPRRGKSHQKQDSSSTIDIPSLTSIAAPSGYQFNDSFDDSMDLIPGMSPPVMMQFARAPRSSIGLGLLPKLGRTPGKEAAKRIGRDLLGDIQRSAFKLQLDEHASGLGAPSGRYGTDSTMSTIPTPPSLSRYTRSAHPYDSTDSVTIDSSLENMMRRVGLNVPSSTSASISSATGGSRSISTEHDVGNSAFVPSPIPEPELKTPDQQRYDVLHLQDEEELIDVAVPDQQGEDSDSDSDSLDETHNPGQPSTAFLMASQHGSDDSFGSSNHSSDSFNEEHDEGGSAPIHPFARVAGEVEGDGFDDSFEEEAFAENQEETVFGVPPAQRLQAANSNSAGRLKLLGEDLLQDTIGIGTQLAKAGRVEESPTPFGGMR